ncbi:MAG: transferrin receptor-like dimerization domain-containing protein [Gemmatimonadota bacterium]
MFAFAVLTATAVPTASALPAPTAPPDSIPGFAVTSLARQRALEARFLAVPTAASAARTAAWLAAEPHLAGTPGAEALAAALADTLRALGFLVEVERYGVWIPHPRRVSLALVERGGPAGDEVVRPLPTRQPSRQPVAPADSFLLLGWNAYGAPGAVEAPVVYASYGLPADYETLARAGIDVEGRIVLARYGRAFRGVKVREAERRGAAAVLLYSDPAQNGYAAGDTVPHGPMMPSDAIQLGTVSYLWRFTGDPLTPGRPALPGVERLEPEESPVLPSIPVVPISYGAAREILEALGGSTPPEGFEGGLPVAYRVGPGPAAVRLQVEVDSELRPVSNVIARIPAAGGSGPGAMILLGNHYDAWLFGGVDPHSGTTAMLEIAHAFAALREGGWTPRREIVLAFWGAEEFNVAGSTEWVEAHADELRERAVAYFNVDVFTAGILDVSGSPSLTDHVMAAADAVQDPVTGRPLAELWIERQREAWGEECTFSFLLRPDAPPPVTCPPFRPGLGPLGAGSDWTAFWHWAGVPSLQWTMNGRGSWASYHSALEDFAYLRDWGDPGFRHTPAFASAMGLAALRLAEADALPFRYTRYADRIEGHVYDLERRMLVADPWIAPAAGSERAGIDSLRAALAGFRDAAMTVEAAQAEALAGEPLRTRLTALDRALAATERALLDPGNLPDRPWYRHTIYAPGTESGYDSVPLPAAALAVAERDPAALRDALRRITAGLARATTILTEAVHR